MVLVPEAETLVGELRRSLTPSGAEGMEAHITVLAPFRHASAIDFATRDLLADLFKTIERFDFALTSIDRFEDGTVYLAPTPTDPFLGLIKAVTARFPDCPPYGGAFETPVPHLTIAGDAAVVADEVVRLPLPIDAVARAVALVERGADLHWHESASFELAPASLAT